MAAVSVSHVSPKVSVSELEEFFSFCGAIQSIAQIDTPENEFHTFQIHFASDKALETAVLLNDAELENVAVKVQEIGLPSYSDSVAREVGDHKVQDAKVTGDPHYDDISQEEKPKSAILAQLLASGYKVSDDLINKAISVDRQKGYSNKFVSFLTDLDTKYLHSQDPDSATAKNIQKAQTSLSSLTNSVQKSSYTQKLHNYFEKSLNTPAGMKVHDFYRSVSKEVQDVHNEAKRLLELKRAEEQPVA